MKTYELSTLEVGAIGEFMRGPNKGRRCKVIFIDDGWICVQTIDGKPFVTSRGVTRNLELVDWRNLKLI